MSWQAQCSCGTEIDWALTPQGRRMPVDHNSAGFLGGTLAVWRKDGELRCRVLAKGESPAAGEVRGTAHWATCPQADEFRKGDRQ